MRVLVIPRDFPSKDDPQAGVFVLRQVQALQALGHSVRVVRIVPKAPPFSKKWRAYRRVPSAYSLEGVDVRTLRAMVPPRMLGIGIVRAQIATALRREAEAFAADIVHVHCVLPTAALIRGIGVPTVLTAHGSDAYLEPWRRADLQLTARSAVAGATAVIAVSDYVKEAVVALGRPDVAVIYNGADESVFVPADREAARARFGIANGRRVVAYAGYLVAAKGLYDLADALAAIGSMRPIALIAGDGPEAHGLRQRFNALGVEYRLLGQVSQVELASVLGAADVFAFPSHAEGLPAAVCEAMLSGRVVVASAVGGIPEIIKHDETGLIVPKSDAQTLAQALRRVLDDPATRMRLERAARDFALRNLTWRVNAAAYDTLYRRVASTEDHLRGSAWPTSSGRAEEPLACADRVAQ
jgi:glycosyltransferase involved in cell wall biosynthesis